MSKNNLEMSDGAIRQRRNLIVITLALIFIHHGQVEFGGEIKLFGTSATIGNPEFIIPFLFLIQAYFLWRFYQYFHADDAYSNLISQYSGNLKNALDDSTLTQIFKYLPDGVTSVSGSYGYTKLGKQNEDSGFYELEVETPTKGGLQTEKHLVKVPKRPIERKRTSVFIGFAFRGKILTDFYIPYLLVVYSVAVYVV